MEWIHKFGTDDLAYFIEVNKILLNIENIIKPTDTIDQVINNYIVTKYLQESEATTYLKKINSSIDIKKINNQIKSNIYKYINTIDKENLIQIASNINEVGYHREFIELLSINKCLKNIDWNIFSKLLSLKRFYLTMFLRVKEIVQTYDKEISNKIKTDNHEGNNFIKAVIDYFTNEVASSNKLFLPNNISNEDFQELVNKYIENDNPNINILERIINFRPSSGSYKIDERIKYKAQKKHTELSTNIFTNDNTMSFTVDIRTEIFDDEKFYRYDATDIHHVTIVFNIKQLEKNLTDESILNFIFSQLPFIDEYSKIHGLTYNKEKDVFLKLFSNIDKNGYQYSITDQVSEQHVYVINYYYLSYLDYKGIKIESVIDYYFNYFLIENYGVSGFNINVNLESDDLNLRIHTLAINLDQIIKQYHHMDSNRNVDLDFVNFNSNIPAYDEVLSRNIKNNIYPANTQNTKMYFLIFNDQSLIYYYDLSSGATVTLEDALLSESANIYHLKDNQKKIIEQMAEAGIVTINNKGDITLKNYEEYLLYKDLYHNKSVNYYLVPDKIKNIIDNELDKNNVISSNTLLSKEEASWFNYVLNDKYSNSIGVRNKYIHGYVESNQQKLMEDYVLLVRMVLILLGKIEYDLTIEENERSMIKLSPSYNHYQLRLLLIK